MSRSARALIFDLDGTLVDTVYAHVFAWQRAFTELGLPIDGWRIHRRIGMSGGLFARAAAREIGRPLSPTEVETIQRRHGEIYREILPERRPLPGAVELLADLRAEGIVHGIATSGRRPEIDASLEALGVGEEKVVVERGDVERAKPEPDLFLTCAERLGVTASTATSSATPSGICWPPGEPGCQHRPVERWLRRGRADPSGAFRVYRDPPTPAIAR